MISTVNISCRHRMLRSSLFLTLMCLVLGACQITPGARSPEVRYSERASERTALQVPPDLREVSRGEQFVLPGTSGAAVTRNTLLPEFESVRYVRNGPTNWLEIGADPEDVWPRLLAYLRMRQFVVERTSPTSGVIVTGWSEVGAGERQGVLKQLLSGDKGSLQRLALRLERAGSDSRLFVRSQVLPRAEAQSQPATVWPPASHDVEVVSAVLQDMLVFFGLDEQRARGVITGSDAQALLQDATLQRSNAGTRLLVHLGFEPSVALMRQSLQNLSLKMVEEDRPGGIFTVADPGGVVGSAEVRYTLEVNPVHVSLVSISVRDSEGGKLNPALEQHILSLLRDRIA